MQTPTPMFTVTVTYDVRVIFGRPDHAEILDALAAHDALVLVDTSAIVDLRARDASPAVSAVEAGGPRLAPYSRRQAGSLRSERP